MVTLNKIYTRTGDDGTTALGTGERRVKSDLRIEAYGTVDELNAVLGVARVNMTGEVGELVSRIQNDLFDVGADLCIPPPKPGEPPLAYEPLRISDAQVQRLEREIDQLNTHLSPLESFILPGGTVAAAHLHHARTVARRAERLMVALKDSGETVDGPVLRYINRLSDFLFVAARFVNDKGSQDVLWRPGANRDS